MEVRTEAATGIASECDGFSHFNVLVGLYENLGEVAINGFKAVGVAQYDIMSIAPALEIGEAYAPGESGVNGVACL